MQFPLNVSFRLLLMCHQMLIFRTGESTIVDMRNDVMLREHCSLTKKLPIEQKARVDFLLLIAQQISCFWSRRVIQYALCHHEFRNSRESFSSGDENWEKGKRLLVTKDGCLETSPRSLVACSTYTHSWADHSMRESVYRGNNNSEARLKNCRMLQTMWNVCI